MRTLFSLTVISDDNLANGRVGFGTQWNGQPIVDVVQFYKAANAVVYGRAKGPQTFSLSVWRFFADEGEALSFACTHGDSLPLQADLLLTDRALSIALRMADAVPSVTIAQRTGIAVLVQYTFTGSRFIAEEAEPNPERIVKFGNASLALNDEEVAVTFASPFDGAPLFVSLVLEPAPGYAAVGVVGYKDISATGFTAVLAAALPAAAYIARWMAEYSEVEESDTAKYGSESPSADDEEIAVAFLTAFGAEPRWISLALEAPSGQRAVGVVGYKDISATGFTAVLDAALPAGGYTARWKAEL